MARPSRLGSLAGRVAVVTGASSGIGEALARRLAAEGAAVALVARRAGRLAELAKEIEQADGSASAHACDVGDRAAVSDTARRIEARWGDIGLLVNAAGVARHVLFVDHDPDDAEALVRTNVLGTMHWIQQVLPGMRARRTGWIVNVSSFAGRVGQPDEAVYSATKFAITGLSQALGPELAPLGIHLLCVHPVLVRTEMFTDEVLARMPKSALRSFIEPDAFADATLRALRRGDTEVMIPRRYGWIAALRSLLPGSLGRVMAKVKLDALS